MFGQEEITPAILRAKPDVVIFPSLSNDTRQLLPGVEAREKRVIVIDVAVTSLGMLDARADQKVKKYRDRLDATFRRRGWVPEFYGAVYGVRGYARPDDGLRTALGGSNAAWRAHLVEGAQLSLRCSWELWLQRLRARYRPRAGGL